MGIFGGSKPKAPPPPPPPPPPAPIVEAPEQIDPQLEKDREAEEQKRRQQLAKAKGRRDTIFTLGMDMEEPEIAKPTLLGGS